MEVEASSIGIFVTPESFPHISQNQERVRSLFVVFSQLEVGTLTT